MSTFVSIARYRVCVDYQLDHQFTDEEKRRTKYTTDVGSPCHLLLERSISHFDVLNTSEGVRGESGS